MRHPPRKSRKGESERTMPKRHKDYANKNKDFLGEKFNSWINADNYFDFGTRKAKFNIGWYQGENFKLFSFTLCEILWARDIGYLCLFEIQVAFFAVSFTIYPFE